jgi:serine/threonine-protein kinase
LATPERILPIFGSAEEPNRTEVVSRPGPQRVEGGRRYSLRGEFEYGGLPDVHLAFLEGAGGFRRAVVVQRLSPASSTRGGEPLLSPDALLGCHTRHPNVIPVLDLIEDRGEHLLVLEYVISTTLARLLRDGNRPPLAITAAIVSGILHALDAAHNARDEFDNALEIVHAGVSPDKVLVGVDGTARLMHFGQDRRGPVRGHGQRQNLQYVSPEQVFDRRADRRSDVFAAGILLWECLSGRPLLDGASAVDAMLRFISRPAFPASAVNPCVPKQLDGVLARALEPTPERRFQSARAFADELESLIEPASREEVARYVEGVAWSAIHEQQLLLRGTDEEEPTPRVATSQLCERSEPRATSARDSSSADDGPTLARGSLQQPALNDLKVAWQTGAPDELTKVDGVRASSSRPELEDFTDRDLDAPSALPRPPGVVEYPSVRRQRSHWSRAFLWLALAAAASALAFSLSRTTTGRAFWASFGVVPDPATPHPAPTEVSAQAGSAALSTPGAASVQATAPVASQVRVLSIDELPVAGSPPVENPAPKQTTARGKRRRAR